MTIRKVGRDIGVMTNAIIIAPKTIIGERKKRRSVIFTPVWTWFISLVILVIIDERPSLSDSVYESPPRCAKSIFLSLVDVPIAALAAKYCAVMAQVKPIIPRATRIRQPFTI